MNHTPVSEPIQRKRPLDFPTAFLLTLLLQSLIHAVEIVYHLALRRVFSLVTEDYWSRPIPQNENLQRLRRLNLAKLHSLSLISCSSVSLTSIHIDSLLMTA
ncbi:MAG: hypothetical protein K8I82_14030, partial [Anaerolineae bacterium]|nr:hypothetical protein [Anaerolineae bacterium]